MHHGPQLPERLEKCGCWKVKNSTLYALSPVAHRLNLCHTWGGRTAQLYELMLMRLRCDRDEDGGGLLTHEMQAHQV